MKFEKVIEFHSYDKFREILYILHKNNRKYLNDALAMHDLNLVQAMCILILDEKSDLSQQDLTDILFLTKSGIKKAVKKLEDMGYVERTESKTDARQHVLNLTDKGKKIIPTLHDINDEWESKMGLPELDDSFIKILHNLAYKSIDLNSKE